MKQPYIYINSKKTGYDYILVYRQLPCSGYLDKFIMHTKGKWVTTHAQNAQIHYFIKCLSKDHLTKHASDVLSCNLKLKFGLRSSFISFLHVFGIAILQLVTRPRLVYSLIAP